MPKWVIYVALVCFWLVYEYLHFNWDAPWPWLAIGNVFAANIDLVQWYEFTGIFGGTIWVLVVNILLYEWLLRLRVIKLTEEAPAQNQSKYIPIAILLLLVIPIIKEYRKGHEQRIENNGHQCSRRRGKPNPPGSKGVPKKKKYI